MGKLNAPRTIPYDFRVFEFDDIVYLFDDSERQYPCTATPHIFAEPIYSLNEEEEIDYTGVLFFASTVEPLEQKKVRLDEEDILPTEPENKVWDLAREAAQSNHLI